MMPITHTAALRTILAGTINDYINNTGISDPSGDLIIRSGTIPLIIFPLANPAFSPPASGVMSLSNTPIVQTSIAAGTADNFQIRDRNNAMVLSGSVTASGGGGDIIVSNTSILNLQDCSLNTLTYTAPV